MNQNGSQERIIKIDEALVKRELGDIVRGTVEETLNKLLDAEADELCGAARYERSPVASTLFRTFPEAPSSGS